MKFNKTLSALVLAGSLGFAGCGPKVRDVVKVIGPNKEEKLFYNSEVYVAGTIGFPAKEGFLVEERHRAFQKYSSSSFPKGWRYEVYTEEIPETDSK